MKKTKITNNTKIKYTDSKRYQKHARLKSLTIAFCAVFCGVKNAF